MRCKGEMGKILFNHKYWSVAEIRRKFGHFGRIVRNMMHVAKEFDTLDPESARRRIVVSRARDVELRAIYPRAAAALVQRMATLDTCESIRKRHLDNLWSITDRRSGELIGMYAMAMLTEDGHVALLDGSFEAHDPRLSHVAATGEPVSAIYKWGVFAPAMAAAAIPLIAERLSAPDYRDLDLYGNGSTPAGRRIMRSVGFRPVDSPKTPDLFVYPRLAKRLRG